MSLYPSNIVLEVAAVCNLGCQGCAIHGPRRFVDRPLGIMDEKIWRQAISEMGKWDRPVNLTTHGGGEPLLHPNLKEILVYAKSSSNIRAGFLTNGMLMDAEWSKFVVSHEIDWVSFSIDGVDPDTHKKVRKGSDLERIESHLRTLIRMKKEAGALKPSITLNMVAYDEVLEQRQPFIQKWIDQVDCVMISHYRNPPDSRRWPLIPAERTPCFLLWTMMIICWDGRVGLCCEDFNVDYSIGDVREKSMEEIWNGEGIALVRRDHQNGEYGRHPMCRICDTWADDLVYEKVNDSGSRMRCRASQTEYTLGPKK